MRLILCFCPTKDYRHMIILIVPRPAIKPIYKGAKLTGCRNFIESTVYAYS